MKTVNIRKHRRYIVTGMHIIIGDKPFFYLQAMFLVKVQRLKYPDNGYQLI